MKKPLLILCCLISVYGWSQSNKDSVLNEINTLRSKKTDIEIKIEKVKAGIFEEMLAEEKLRSSFNNMLVQMDSLTGQKLKLQRKKQLTAQEQAKITRLDKLLDDYSKKIQDVDMELTTIINNRRDVIQELQKNIESADVLNNRIKELQTILK